MQPTVVKKKSLTYFKASGKLKYSLVILSLPMIGEIVYPKGIFKALMFLLCSARFINYTKD